MSARPCARGWLRATAQKTSPGGSPPFALDIAARPLVPAVKYLVGKRARDGAWATVLPPFVPLDDAARRALDGIAGQV